MRKKLLFLPVVLALLSSCSTLNSYYQICTVSSDLDKSTSGAYEFKDSSCDVVYDFWTNGGLVSFSVTNNSDEMMFVDLSKSFFIKNGIAHDYFLNRTTTTSSSLSSSESYAAAGTAYGYWNIFGKKVPGTYTATAASATGSQKSASVSFEERPIVAIPPHASKVFSEYSIMVNRYQDCDLYESPSKQELPQVDFNLSNSPVAFTNYLCYRIGDNGEDKIIENSFYVSQVRNQHHKATFHKVNVGCPNDTYSSKEEVFIRTSPSEFYIKYSPRQQKTQSSQEKKNNKKNFDDLYTK